MPISKACINLIDKIADEHAFIEYMSHLSASEKATLQAFALKERVKAPGATHKAAEFVVNSLISTMAAPIMNAVSAVTQMVLKPALRTLETAFSRDVKAGEGLSMLHGIVQGFGEGLAFAKKGLMEGKPIDIHMAAKAFGQSERQFQKYLDDNFISAEKGEC